VVHDQQGASIGPRTERRLPDSGIVLADTLHKQFYRHGFDPFHGSGHLEEAREFVTLYVHRILEIAEELP
jgi:hypothetical protein